LYAPTPDPATTDAAATQAPEAPKKRGGGLTTVIIIILILAIAAVAWFKFVSPAIDQSKFKIGACLNTQIEQGTTTAKDVKVVDCSDAAAKSKIVAVFTGKSISDAPNVCPTGSVSALEAKRALGGTLLLCLGSK